MNTDILKIVLAATMVGISLGYLIGRWISLRASIGLAIAFILLAAALIVMGRGASGWDGLAYVILATTMAAPASVGALIGTGLARWRRGT